MIFVGCVLLLKAFATSLTIQSGSIELKAPAIPAAAAMIAKLGGPIHHNP